MQPLESNLKKIREACINENPGIIELKFGCEVEYSGEKTMVAGYDSDFKEGKYIFISPEIKGNNMVFLDDKSFKIFGRPIRLADVLLAINKNNKTIGNWPDSLYYFVVENGTFFQLSVKKMNRPSLFEAQPKEYQALNPDWIKNMLVSWNLKDDNLEHQSEETINFIASLL